MDSNMEDVKRYRRTLTGSSDINLKSVSMCVLHHTKAHLGCYLMTEAHTRVRPINNGTYPEHAPSCCRSVPHAVLELAVVSLYCMDRLSPSICPQIFQVTASLWQWFHRFIDTVWRSNFVFVLTILVLVHILCLACRNNQSLFHLLYASISGYLSHPPQALFFQPEKS